MDYLPLDIMVFVPKAFPWTEFFKDTSIKPPIPIQVIAQENNVFAYHS
ncbi:hypothetical protein FVEN_g12941 [Fusarium venenatum]|nr:hypothetical protein FVEN_g12941 [Fusarium venenatum]